jgi:hypothetical protein
MSISNKLLVSGLSTSRSLSSLPQGWAARPTLSGLGTVIIGG